MAGDWIPCELALFTKREVTTVSRRTKRSRFEVAGLLLAFWGWFSTESADGMMAGVDLDSLADIVGGDRKFWQAVADEKWIKVTEAGLEIPNADRWITKGAKARLQKNRRQAGWRGGHVDGGASTDPPTRPPTKAPTGPSRKPSTTGQKSRDLSDDPTQKHATGDLPPTPIGSVGSASDFLDDPDPEGSRTLAHKQREQIAELRRLTGESGNDGLYASIVRSLSDLTYVLISRLKDRVNDTHAPVTNPGATMVALAKEIATGAGIRLFRDRRAA